MKMLICVSKLPYAESTLLFGGLIAGLEKADVTLTTVIRNEVDRPLAEEMLARAQALLTVPQVETAVCIGSPAAAILNQAESGDYDTIVVGGHILGGFFDRFATSTMKKVATKAATNVLVVQARRSAINHILVCTAGREVDRPLIEKSASLAKGADAKVTVMFVSDPVPAMYTGLKTMEETLSELLQSDTVQARELKWSMQYFKDTGVDAKLKLRSGIVTDEIHHEIKVGDYDLVIVGAQTENNFWNELLVGSITGDIVELSSSSVFVVRTHR
ncbi:MAG: universal stress protein [Anaerolineae bacterium]|nr:universal stress protein [Anaerolineae bacterium]